MVTTCIAPGLEQDEEPIEFCYETLHAKAAVMEASRVSHTVKFSWVQFRVIIYKATPPELRPSHMHATIMVFFNCQAVQDNHRNGKCAKIPANGITIGFGLEPSWERAFPYAPLFNGAGRRSPQGVSHSPDTHKPPLVNNGDHPFG